MRRTIGLLASAAVAIGLAATEARAQTRTPPRQAAPKRPRVPALIKPFATVGASLPFTSWSFDQHITFQATAGDPEDAEITGRVRLGWPAGVSVGAGIGVWRRVGVGLLVTGSRASGRMDATFLLPDPFLFAAAHSATGQGHAERQTIDAHLQAIWLIRDRGPWHITIFGGPTFTRISEALPTDQFEVDYAYPFDTVTVTPVDRGTTSAGGIGGHGGFSVTRRLRRHVNLDVRVLVSHAAVRFDVGAGSTTVTSGGGQATVGLRFGRSR